MKKNNRYSSVVENKLYVSLLLVLLQLLFSVFLWPVLFSTVIAG